MEISKQLDQVNLDSSLVTTWLDNHPEFLHDYLKKLQIQRRRTSILNDKSGLLLANLHSNSQAQKSQTNLKIAPEQISPNRVSKPPVSPNASSLISLPLLLSTTNTLNASFSEPNITPAVDLNNEELLLVKQQQVSRNKFKQLSLYEKMYTLVKTLYQSLDLKTTCKKILNTVSLLLDADRCSLFLVVDDDDQMAVAKKCLVSVVFDAKSNSLNKLTNNYANENLDHEEHEDDEEEDNEQIKIPYGKGIAGYVASTGETLNIPDAYLDPRFNATIDQQTGYRTKSILCLPILNENGQCIAVAEAINKLSEDFDSQENLESTKISFTKEDEEVFSFFDLNYSIRKSQFINY